MKNKINIHSARKYVEEYEKIEKQLQDKYFKNDRKKCPHCDSILIHPNGDVEYDGYHVHQNMECSKCKEQWSEDYTVTGITLYDEDIDELVIKSLETGSKQKIN